MGAFRVAGTQCCGIFELADISKLQTPEEMVRETARLMAVHTGQLWGTGEFSKCPSFLMFSGVVAPRKKIYEEHYHADRSDNYGQALADYITANGLGTVSASQPAKNHSGNMLQVWLWAPNWTKMKVIYKSLEPSLTVNPTRHA